MKLSEIHIYPVKSLAGISLTESSVGNLGLANDRQLMLVDDHGVFISQRRHPQMALLKPRLEQQQLTISHPSGDNLIIRPEDFHGPATRVEVWQTACSGFVAQNPINQWFSDFLGFSVRLVNYNHQQPRATDAQYSNSGDTVSYADGFPLLVTSQASLDELNQRLPHTSVSMSNFRPNLVVSGSPAYDEDRWKSICIGEVEFEVVKPCSRCVLTTVDPLTGVKRSDGEPLKTLSGYRRGEGGVLFGMNLIPRSAGKISCGENLVVKY